MGGQLNSVKTAGKKRNAVRTMLFNIEAKGLSRYLAATRPTPMAVEDSGGEEHFLA